MKSSEADENKIGIGANHPTAKGEIISNEVALLRAMQNSDIAELDRLIHDDLAFVIPGGQVVTKTMDLEGYRSGMMKVENISSEEQEIKLADDTATVVAIIRMKGTFGDQAFDGIFRFLRVWKLCGTEWKIIAGSSTPMN